MKSEYKFLNYKEFTNFVARFGGILFIEKQRK